MPEEQRPSAVGVRRRACVNCTSGKAKCSPWSESICERCHRLEKDCVYLTIASKRKSPKSNVRVQPLERTVERLVAPLPTKVSLSSATSESPPQSGSQLRDSEPTCSLPSVPSERKGRATPLSSLPESSTEDFGFDVIDRGLVSVETAQILLDIFRLNAINNFPFVIIPFDTTLNMIRKNQPFLFLAIVAVMAASNSPLQRQLGEELRIQMHQRILLGFESSLELLQGLLVYLAWYYYFAFPHRQQMLLLTQLSVNLVHQLEIDKNPRNKKHKVSFRLVNGAQEDTDVENSAKMRALLGTYYLSSAVSTTFRIRSIMPYTKYIEQCCLYLAQTKEFQTDELISALVRNEELSRRVQDTFSYDDLDNTEIRGEHITKITTESLLNDLEDLQKTKPEGFKDNPILNLELDFLRCWILEVAFHNELWESPLHIPSLSKSTSFSPTRMKILWDFLQSITTALERFLALSNPEIFSLTYPILSKVCYSIMSLAKIETCDPTSPSSSLSSSQTQKKISNPCLVNCWTAAKEAELPALVRKVPEKFKKNATNMVTAEGQPDTMTIFSLTLGAMISRWDMQTGDSQATVVQIESVRSKMADTSVMRDQMVSGIDSTVVLGSDTGNTNYFGMTGSLSPGQFPGFQLDVFEDSVWEKLLDDFPLDVLLAP